MNDVAGQQTGAARARLRGLAEAALAPGAPALQMAKPLRDRYEAEAALQRSVELRRTTRISVCVYVASVLLLNLLVVPHPSWLDVAMQIGFTPATALLIASLFYRPDTPPFARESAATVAASCFSLATVLAVGSSPIETAQINFCMISLPVLYVLVFVRLRFAGALAFTVFSAGLLIIVLLLRNDLTAGQRAYPMGFMLIAAAPGLLAAYRSEADARRIFLRMLLLNLRIDELEAQSARLNLRLPGDAAARLEWENHRSEGVASGRA